MTSLCGEFGSSKSLKLGELAAPGALGIGRSNARLASKAVQLARILGSAAYPTFAVLLISAAQTRATPDNVTSLENLGLPKV